MIDNIWCTVIRLKWFIIGIGILYFLILSVSLIVHFLNPERNSITSSDENQLQQIERIFGRFREPVREGYIGAILLCCLMIFSINTLGNVLTHTIPCIFLIPVVTKLFKCAWIQGMAISSLQASSSMSSTLFLIMIFLETLGYIIASVAGTNIGFSILIPKIQGVTSRWMAFKLGCVDAGRLYIIIALILAVQAIWEILYVRKVLLMGGTGIPLTPY